MAMMMTTICRRFPLPVLLGLIALVWSLGLGGCSSVAVKTLPNTDLRHWKRVFVEHRLSDGRNLDEIIARDLRALGYQASAGAPTIMPRDTEVIVAYADTWDWEVRNFMIGFDVQVREARNDRILATGHRYRPGEIFSSTPETMIRGVIEALFKPI
jgi:hypothetical protein